MTAMYFSSSRSDFQIIKDMPTKHLSNAAKKLVRGLVSSEAAEAEAPYDNASFSASDVVVEMIDELASRIAPAGSVEG